MRSVFVAGAAGLLGQNLIARVKRPGLRIVAADKHSANLAVLRRLHPDIEVIEADLASPGSWTDRLVGMDAVVIGQAQIGGLRREEFVANNVTATERLLEAASRHRVPYLVHISSSVVNSEAVDFYTESKKAQERLVDACAIPHVCLRPTLMFGWFDRKHLGWLQRFMRRTPVFPVPGHGRYVRQPLYVGDFCAIIAACLQRRTTGTYDITGLERIHYVDLIRRVGSVTGASTRIVSLPYGLFWLLLATYALFDRNPPFTVKQLEALVIPEEFSVIDWPGIFGVAATPIDAALGETFLHPVYSSITLEF